MTMVWRILLLVAGLAFGAMPPKGLAAADSFAPLSGMAMAGEASVFDHHRMMVTSLGGSCPHEKRPDADPTGHTAMTGGHCSTCLTLPPMIMLADLGDARSSDQASSVAARLTSALNTPIERPPRPGR